MLHEDILTDQLKWFCHAQLPTGFGVDNMRACDLFVSAYMQLVCLWLRMWEIIYSLIL